MLWTVAQVFVLISPTFCCFSVKNVGKSPAINIILHWNMLKCSSWQVIHFEVYWRGMVTGKEHCDYWTFRSGLQQARQQQHLKAKRIDNPVCHPISCFLQLWMGWEAATVIIFVSEALRAKSCEYSDEFLLPWRSALYRADINMFWKVCDDKTYFHKGRRLVLLIREALRHIITQGHLADQTLLCLSSAPRSSW